MGKRSGSPCKTNHHGKEKPSQNISHHTLLKCLTFEKNFSQKMFRLLFCIALVLGPMQSFSQPTQQMRKDFTTAFSKGDTDALHPYFKGFVNMNIPGEKGFYSQSKSRWLLEDFFREHKVSAFALKESGFSGDNYYFIGLYTSGTRQWNVYFVFSPGKNGYQVQQIDIEKNEK